MRYLSWFLFVVVGVALARVGFDLVNAGALRKRKAKGRALAVANQWVNPKTGKPAAGPATA